MSLSWPAYLVGLLAVGLPWLLHRFSRTDPPERPFPSRQFLQASEPPVSRERTLRYRWLFALRVLLLIGLCVLFAEPWLRTDGPAAGAVKHHLIAIDTSLSQRLDERWARSRAAAREAIDAVPSGHTLQLLAADTALTGLTDVSSVKAAARAALSALQPGHAAVDYGEWMQRLDVIAARSELPVVVTLITDAQRRSLPQRLGALTARNVSSLRIVNVAEAEERNEYLSASARTSDGVHARVSVSVGSSVTGGDASEVTRQLSVSHEGRVLATENVTLVPGESRTLSLDRITLPAIEEVKLDIAFEERDSLPDDDAVSVVVRGVTPVGVGIRAIDTPLPRQAPVFVATALETDDVARIIEAPASQGLSDELQHAIVFADLGDTGQIPTAVEQFVQDGGNALLVDVSAMRDSSAFDEAVGIGMIDTAHPLALGSLNWYEASWYGSPGWVNPSAGDSGLAESEAGQASGGSRTLLQTAAGTPVLIERRLAAPGASNADATSSVDGSGSDDGVRLDRAGSLLVLADPLDGETSDFPLQPAFVGFMQRVVDFFVISSAIPERLNAGSRLDLPTNVQVLNAEGERMLDLGGGTGNQSLQLNEPGLYNVINQQGSLWLEVMIDAGESDIATLPADELRAWEARHGGGNDPERGDVAGGGSAATTAGTTSAGATEARNENVLQLWRWLLPLTLAFLIGESLLANRRLDVRRDGS